MLKNKIATLRPIRMDDWDNFTKWFNDQEVTRYLTSYLPMTEISEKKWIEETAAKRQPVFVIDIKNNGGETISIGNCGFHRLDHKNANAELGIVIGEKEYWGVAYGFEALKLLIDYGFNFLNLHKIYSGAYALNKRSIGLHKKLGFVQEGERKDHVFTNGRYHNIIEFGLLREEWKKSK